MTSVDIKQGAILKSGDTAPELRLELLDAGDNPADVSGDTVTVIIKEPYTDSPIVNETMTLVDAANGLVEYDWQSGDTDTPGTYDAEVKVDDGTDTISYPNGDFFTVRIMEDLV